MTSFPLLGKVKQKEGLELAQGLPRGHRKLLSIAKQPDSEATDP